MGMDRENADKGTQAGLQDQAAQWFARLLDSQCPPAERAAFERWRTADPKHAAAYRELELLWKRSAEAVKDPALMAAANRALRRDPPTHARRWWFPALAAGVALLVAAITLPRWLATPDDPVGTAYATSAGQERSEQLADGSSVLLDTDSEVVVRYSARTRRVDLLRGRAQFSVQGNHAWPFVVHAGNGTVTAVGTQFQVRLDNGATDVALLKGKLAIAAQSPDGQERNASLVGGQSLSFDERGNITPVRTIDLQQAQGWTQGKLFVHDWRLPQLLAEMNRYSTTKVAIGDPSLQNIHISGVFRTGDQQTFLAMLQQGWSIRAARAGDKRIVLSR